MAWTRLNPSDAQALSDRLRAVDPVGTRVHAVFAAAVCFFAGWPTSYVSWAGLPLLVCWVVRMFNHHRVLGPLVWQPSVRFLLAWSVWLALSLIWTADRAAGVEELGPLMFGAFIPAIWPVIAYRRLLVGALIVGVFCGQLSQLGHGIGPTLGIDAITFNRLPGRNSGWWDPVVGGSVLCAALGVHMAGAFTGRRMWVRLLGFVGVATCALSIAATGTRGAWIGALFTIGACTPVAAWWCLRQRDRAGVVRLAIFVVVGIVTLAANIAARPAGLERRYQAGVHEVRAALEEGDYRSDTGLRIAMAEWAGAAVRCQPLLGVGAGGYQAWVRATADEARSGEKVCAAGPIENGGDGVHAHAHSWFPHVAATTGVIGLALMLGLVFSAMAEGWLGAVRHDAAGYAELGPMMGLFGLIGAGLFDSISVNQQTWYVAMVLVALCGRLRPACIEPASKAQPPFRGVGE